MNFFQLQFHDKRNPHSLNVFTRKNKRYSFVYHPKPDNRHSLSRDHQTVTIMNYCCYFFDGPWKVKKVKYTVLRLNALTKLQSTRGASRHPALTGNCPACNHIRWSSQSSNWFVVNPFQVACGAWDSVDTREVPLEKKVDIIFIIITCIQYMKQVKNI